MKTKIAVAMSGGVDSSVAALLLKQNGYDIIGFFMQIWDYSDSSSTFGSCCSLDDLSDARRVAEQISIPFYIVRLENEFRRHVVDYFISEYLNGRTPNPCIECNRKIKFEYLYNKARYFNVDTIATGHYAKTILKETRYGNRYFVSRGYDNNRDQSYFLYNLSHDQLKNILFPIGDLTKDKVRAIASEFGLLVADKVESREICFIPDNNYRDFIIKETGNKIIKGGDIIDTKGRLLGRHNGIAFYTIGQRKKIGINTPTPLYVVSIDKEKDIIVVGNKDEVCKRDLVIKDISLNVPSEEIDKRDIMVQIRYNHQPAKAHIVFLNDNEAKVIFYEKQHALTPGQAAVLYNDELVLGGGVIDYVSIS